MTTEESALLPALNEGIFKTADEKYRSMVAYYQQDMEWTTLTHDLSHWCRRTVLSEIESKIFNIDAVDVPALAIAYERYENIIGISDVYFWQFRDQERQDHGSYFLGDHAWSFGKAVAFMREVCGLPGPKCLGWVLKVVAAEIRGGVLAKTALVRKQLCS